MKKTQKTLQKIGVIFCTPKKGFYMPKKKVCMPKFKKNTGFYMPKKNLHA
jgi:hypothetical protein